MALRSNKKLDGHGAPPCSILWSPIPLITWLLPPVGHMGVSSSTGVAVDFAGPYTVHEDVDGIMIFGAPSRYLPLDPNPQWDNHLENASCIYRNKMYNILGNNCHAFVSTFMNQLSYQGYTNWNMIHLAALMFVKGRYTSLGAALHTWLPFCIIAVLGGYFGRLYFLYAWLGLTVPLVLWFFVYVYVIQSHRLVKH